MNSRPRPLFGFDTTYRASRPEVSEVFSRRPEAGATNGKVAPRRPRPLPRAGGSPAEAGGTQALRPCLQSPGKRISTNVRTFVPTSGPLDRPRWCVMMKMAPRLAGRSRPATPWASGRPDMGRRVRKVRAPQGTVLGNTQAGQPADRATETDRQRAPAAGRSPVLRARVKRWCKRPPGLLVRVDRMANPIRSKIK